jgi:hypothetical protein
MKNLLCLATSLFVVAVAALLVVGLWRVLRQKA